MKEKERINLFIQYLIISGKYESQADIGKKLGYDNKSSFSQLLKKEITSTFKEKFIKLFPEYEDFNINFEGSTELESIKKTESKDSKFEKLDIEEKLNFIYNQNIELKNQNTEIKEAIAINKETAEMNKERIDDVMFILDAHMKMIFHSLKIGMKKTEEEKLKEIIRAKN